MDLSHRRLFELYGNGLLSGGYREPRNLHKVKDHYKNNIRNKVLVVLKSKFSNLLKNYCMKMTIKIVDTVEK